MKALVTGATGFLGTHLCKRLQADGHQVVAVGSKQADLTRQGALDALGEKGFDRIFHLAAWTQAGDFCLYHPGEQWVINQQMNTTVLEWWQRAEPEAKLIFMGTSCAYDPDMKHSEENYLTGKPIDSLFTYAMTKRMLYTGALALNKQYGLTYLSFVPSTLYGPGYHTDGRQMHFIFDLVRKIMRGKLYGETVTLWGDGHQRRELVFVNDFIDIMLKVDAAKENELYNIGAGQDHTIRDFAKAICDKVEYDFAKIGFDTSKYVGAKAKFLATDRIKEVLPDYEMTPLEEGLSVTIDWFWENKDTLLPPP